MTASRVFRSHRIIRHFIGRPRLMISTVIGLVVFAIMPSQWHLATRLLVAWNLCTATYVIAATIMMTQATPQTIRRRAILTDESRFVVLTLSCLAAAAALAAIFAQLSVMKDVHGLLRAVHLTLAAVTVVLSWTFIHIIFAQHYAHEYFLERPSEMSIPEEYRGGLRFPGGQKLDFTDFLYFSFIIGVASQTADVEICSKPMRRVSLAHSLVSFFFNTTILALTINIAAGLLAP